MLLIATDEAGYGPKLGPLVIAATAWRLDDEAVPDDLHSRFAPLGDPITVGGRSVKVDDSKKVFKPNDTLDVLHTIVSASVHWLGWDQRDVSSLLRRIAHDDISSIQQAAWLARLSNEALLDRSTTQALIERWRARRVALSDLRVRIITARQFNSSCKEDYNKADLLSESTLGLVSSMASDSRDRNVCVFCDRHGGRRYYAGVIQHLFPEHALCVVAESKMESRYRLTRSNQTIDVRFTVKGDSFIPVALSSMHAKYWRERMMESMNRFFVERHRGDSALRPTAGYPVDADRYLIDIAPIIAAEGIDREDLVRAR